MDDDKITVGIVAADVGQVWEDEDGKRWRIVALNADWLYFKRHGNPRSDTQQVSPGWLTIWTRVA